MAKNKQIFIGDVEDKTPEEKKTKLQIKSKIIVGSVVFLIFAVSIGSFLDLDNSPNNKRYVTPGIDLNTDNEVTDKDLWRDNAQRDIVEFKKTITEINHKFEKEKERISNETEAIKRDLENSLMQNRDLEKKLSEAESKIVKVKEEILKEGAVKQTGSTGSNSSESPVNNKAVIPVAGSDDNLPNKPFANFKMPNPKTSPTNEAPAPPSNPFASVIKKDNADKKDRPIVVQKASEEKLKVDSGPVGLVLTGMPQEEANKFVSNKVKSSKKMVKTDFGGYLPDGSFAEIAVISGLDASAAADTQKNPQPVLMRIQSDAIVPSIQGLSKYKLKGCFLTGSSYGDVSSERVMVKPTRLSCVDVRRHFVISAKVDGYIADFDNSLGLRGKVEYRDGARIAKSILASSASSLASIAALGSGASTTTLSSTLTPALDTGNLNLPSTGQVGTAIGAEVFGSSAEIIAKRYADQAKNIFPVVVLPGGRKGTVVFTKGINLKWERYDSIYQESVTPEGEIKTEVLNGIDGGLIN